MEQTFVWLMNVIQTCSMKQFLQNFLLLGVSLAVGLGLIEATLWYLDLPKFHEPRQMTPQFLARFAEKELIYYTNMTASQIKFVYSSNPRGYFDEENAVYHQTNSWGFRGEDFETTKPPGTVRIVFLGDSFTFGEGVKDQDIFPVQVEKLLNRHYAEQNIKFESYNFGVGGYNTQQALFLLKSLAWTTLPDVIVLGYTLNDAEPAILYKGEDGSIQQRFFRAELFPTHPTSWPYHFRLVRTGWQLWHRQQIHKRTLEHYSTLYTDANPHWSQTRSSLRELKHICDSLPLGCYILVFPLLYELNDDYPFLSIHQLIAKEVNSPSKPIHLIDLLPVLKGYKDSELWVHPSDQHPNEMVHRLVAQRLFEELIQERNPTEGSSP